MLFEASRPVVGQEFFDREAELANLIATVAALRKGTTRYVAILGLRKVGKTSLLYEFMRRVASSDLACFAIDCWEKKPTPRVFFREFLARAIDAFVLSARPKEVTRSLKASLADRAETTSCIADLRRLELSSIDRACTTLLQMEDNNLSDAVLEAVMDFPESVARETGTRYVVLIDEFQELQDLNVFKAIKENIGDIYAFFRARWQSHRNVNYILSGSRMTTMREILTRERGPLSQHFDIQELKPFAETQARELLRLRSEGEGKPIPEDIAERIIRTVGTYPFYLQVVGAQLCALDKIDENGFKAVLQNLLFEENGRLHLYFRDLVGRVVGRSASIERTLVAIAREPARLSELARRLGTAPGTLKSWVDRCRDLVMVEEGTYLIADPCLALWLKTKSEERPVLPAVVLGNEAEQLVARRMAAAGFELVFQSRASRGAFDLLAIQGATEVGVQVKKARLPFYLEKEELGRMQHWAKRLGWIPLLAIVDEGAVRFYRVGGLRTSGRRCRFDARTEGVENLLELSH